MDDDRDAPLTIQRALVTGGAGFIGSHLTRGLATRGARVRILDDLSTGSLASLSEMPHVEFVEGDVREPSHVRAACDGIDTVFHLGALASVQLSVDDPATSLAVNLTGTLNVLEAARAAGTRRVVIASSSAVYGGAPGLPKRESMVPAPMSAYAVGKLGSEGLAATFAAVHGLETVALRFFNVYGPGQDPSSPYSAVIPRFATALLAGESPVVYGDGGQSRDFIFVEDVVDAVVRAAQAPPAAVAGRAFNVASGTQVSLNDLLGTLGTILDRTASADYQPAREGDIRHSTADISAASEAFGFAPQTSLAEGLRRTVAHYAEARPASAH